VPRTGVTTIARCLVLHLACMQRFTPIAEDAPSKFVSRLPMLIHLKRSWPRLQSLGIIWFVSLSILIANSIYFLRGGTAPTGALQQSHRLLGALIHEITSLLLLWFVMNKDGVTRKDIGWNPNLWDFARGVALLLGAFAATLAIWIPGQLLYRAYSGQFLTPKSLTSMFGFGVSALSITFICLNPFFEELVVRAYTMSEIMSLGGSRAVAIVVSVAIQVRLSPVPGPYQYHGVDSRLYIVLDLLREDAKDRAGHSRASLDGLDGAVCGKVLGEPSDLHPHSSGGGDSFCTRCSSSISLSRTSGRFSLFSSFSNSCRARATT
jgi:membrane protease YdiL (CAAX protease family)